MRLGWRLAARDGLLFRLTDCHCCRPHPPGPTDLRDVFFTKLLSRLGRKSKNYDMTQVGTSGD